MFILHGSEGWQVQNQGTGRFIAWWWLTSWFIEGSSCCVLTCVKDWESLSDLFYIGTNAIYVGFALMSYLPSKGSASKHHHNEDEAFNMLILGHTSIQSIAVAMVFGFERAIFLAHAKEALAFFIIVWVVYLF